MNPADGIFHEKQKYDVSILGVVDRRSVHENDKLASRVTCSFTSSRHHDTTHPWPFPYEYDHTHTHVENSAMYHVCERRVGFAANKERERRNGRLKRMPSKYQN